MKSHKRFYLQYPGQGSLVRVLLDIYLCQLPAIEVRVPEHTRGWFCRLLEVQPSKPVSADFSLKNQPYRISILMNVYVSLYTTLINFCKLGREVLLPVFHFIFHVKQFIEQALQSILTFPVELAYTGQT